MIARRTRLFPVVPLALCLNAAPVISAPLIEITQIRAFSLGSSTRVMIETSGQFTYSATRASSPERLIVDIPRSRTWIEHQRTSVKDVGDALIEQIRVADSAPGETRVVLDLKRPVSFRAVQLSSPSRLMIEIRPDDSTPPVAPAEGRSESAVVAPRPAPLPETVPHVTENATGSLTRALGLKIHRIVIDPGHGGNDAGAIGRHGVREKDVVLDVGLRLAALVRTRSSVEALLTRGDDTFIPLRARTDFANDRKADLFLSIHANSSRNAVSAGTETYYLDLTNSRLALDVAARENAGSPQTISDLKDLVRAIAIKDKMAESQAFARGVDRSIGAMAGGSNSGSVDRGVKRAPFVVLIGAEMPSILAEIGFLTNDREETSLRSAAYRERIAEALFKGISSYSQSLSGRPLAER